MVHFAAESHVDRSIREPEVFVRTNVLGTAVMLNCAKEAWELPEGGFRPGKKFLHVSTDEVYGSLPDDDSAFFYEDTPYDPHSPYSASKAGADMLVKSYMDTYRFPANITNCSNNYGPYQFPEKLIPLIINNCLQGRKLPVYGDGKNVRDWLYVEDHAKAIDIRLDLVRRDGVSAVMSLAVLHIGDQVCGHMRLSGVVVRQHLLQGLYDDMDDLDVLLLVMAAYVVGLEQLSLLLCGGPQGT